MMNMRRYISRWIINLLAIGSINCYAACPDGQHYNIAGKCTQTHFKLAADEIIANKAVRGKCDIGFHYDSDSDNCVKGSPENIKKAGQKIKQVKGKCPKGYAVYYQDGIANCLPINSP